MNIKTTLVWASLLVTGSLSAQNYNNGEDLAKFVVSEQFANMPSSELKPLYNRIDQHLKQCVAATVSDLRKHPRQDSVTAAQLERHHRLWQPYHQSVCDLYGSDQPLDASQKQALKLRCQIFNQSTFYSEVLGYQREALKACQGEQK